MPLISEVWKKAGYGDRRESSALSAHASVESPRHRRAIAARPVWDAKEKTDNVVRGGVTPCGSARKPFGIRGRDLGFRRQAEAEAGRRNSAGCDWASCLWQEDFPGDARPPRRASLLLARGQEELAAFPSPRSTMMLANVWLETQAQSQTSLWPGAATPSCLVI